MPTFKVLPRCYGNESDLDDEGRDVVCDTAEDAATGFVEDNYSELEYPKSEEIMVRRQGESEIKLVTVTVEMYPHFSARMNS